MATNPRPSLTDRVVDHVGREWAAKTNGSWACLDEDLHADTIADIRDWYGITEIRPEPIPEPTGLGAVVEDTDGLRYVRVGRFDGWNWLDGAARCKWDHINAVRVLNEGVAS